MSVVGYNHQDTEDCIGIEMEMQEAGPVACVYIGQAYSQTEHHLTYAELCNFIGQAREVKDEMEWAMAQYAYASEGYSAGTNHLAPLVEGEGKFDAQGKSLCGRLASLWAGERKWSLTPVVGEPGESCCKRCLAVYRKQKERQL